MIPDRSVAEAACAVLNEAFKADPAAIRIWLCQAVQTNDVLADHPEVIVGDHPVRWTLGPLGLINGIVARLSGFRIASDWGEPDPDTRERRFLGFVVVAIPQP